MKLNLFNTITLRNKIPLFFHEVMINKPLSCSEIIILQIIVTLQNLNATCRESIEIKQKSLSTMLMIW